MRLWRPCCQRQQQQQQQPRQRQRQQPGREAAVARARTHGDGGLASAGLAGDEDGTAGDPAVPDHLENNAGRLARVRLADHALRDGAGLKGVIEAEATDVRVGADALDARDVLDL